MHEQQPVNQDAAKSGLISTYDICANGLAGLGGVALGRNAWNRVGKRDEGLGSLLSERLVGRIASVLRERGELQGERADLGDVGGIHNRLVAREVDLVVWGCIVLFLQITIRPHFGFG